MNKIVNINNIEYPVYADLDDASVYNNAIYGSTWSSLTPTIQSQLLIESTRVIDSYKYIGEKQNTEQPLKFPRVTASGKVSDEQTLIDLCCQIANYIYNITMSKVSQGILRDVRDEMFSKMEALPISFFDSNKHGDIMSRYTNDIETLNDMISQSIPQAIGTFVTIVTVFIVQLSLMTTLIKLLFDLS